MLNRRCLLAGMACMSAVVSGTSHAYEVVAVGQGAVVRGAVGFVGAVPKGDPLIVGKDNHICGDGHVVANPVRVNDGRLADAVVFLDGVAKGKAWSAGSAPQIAQEKCAFHPFVQVARKGSELKIVNKDPLLHNIHTYELIGRARRTMFNVAQPKAGQVDVQPLAVRRGDVVEVACDAHNWMSAWIYTLDHPYWAVVGADGRFELSEVPAGSYRLVAWHPVLGIQSTQIEVKAGSRPTVDLTYSGS